MLITPPSGTKQQLHLGQRQRHSIAPAGWTGRSQGSRLPAYRSSRGERSARLGGDKGGHDPSPATTGGGRGGPRPRGGGKPFAQRFQVKKETFLGGCRTLVSTLFLDYVYCNDVLGYALFRCCAYFLYFVYVLYCTAPTKEMSIIITASTLFTFIVDPRAIIPSLCRQRLTALRLELWLRSLLHDVDGDYSGLDVELKNSIPDVFRTARTLARTVSRHAFATVTGGEGDGAGANGHHPFRRDCDFGSVESIRRSYSNGDGRDRREGTEQEHAVDGTLEPPRRALARRVPSALRTGALMSWVSSLVTIIRQYRQWLPWQAFADELRDLVLLSVRRTVQTGGAHQNGTGEGPPASAAALFAACELLAAWEGGAVRTEAWACSATLMPFSCCLCIALKAPLFSSKTVPYNSARCKIAPLLISADAHKLFCNPRHRPLCLLWRTDIIANTTSQRDSVIVTVFGAGYPAGSSRGCLRALVMLERPEHGGSSCARRSWAACLARGSAVSH